MTVNIVSGTSTAYNAKASQVTGSCESATIQWSNMPAIGSVLEDNISHNNKTKYEFSCLAAVQHWYTDSATTSGEQLEAVLRSYHSGTEGNDAAKRFTTWIGSYTQETLQDKFFDYCNDYSTNMLIKWPFLVQYSIYPEQQQAFSQAFANYFWIQKVKESLQ